jgi:hypothetical protein
MLSRSRVRPRTALPAPSRRAPALAALALASSVLALLAGAGPAAATLPQQSGAVAALAPTNLQVFGPPTNSRLASSVAVGDVNGDGVDDMILGASDPIGKAGGAYVIYGTEEGEPTKVTLAADGEIPASQGFRIVAPSGSELLAGRAVAEPGDVNGDGYDDVIVGANGIAHNYGGAFVVYGGPHDGTVDLTEAGLPESVGFMLKAPRAVDNAGLSLAGGEDVNGDGVDDLVIGDSGYDPNDPAAPYNTGAAFVVYGQDGERPTVELGSVTANGEGFAIVGAEEGGYLEAVGMAGDVNGDGVGDVIVGATGTYRSGTFVGYAAVVYGAASRGGDVVLSRAGLDPAVGFMLESSGAGDGTGTSVAGTGDVDADGYGDVVIGAPWSGTPGSAEVVYGGATHGTVTLAPTGPLGAAGFVVHGPTEGSLQAETGTSVAGGADVNGDGIDDTVIGAPSAGYATSGGGVSGLGEAAVVYGVAGGRGELTLPAPKAGESMDPGEGFLIRGEFSESFFSSPHDPPAGTKTVALGDVNGDGRADVLVGTGYYRYLIGALGFGTPTLAYPSATSATVGEPLDIGPESVGRTGAASFAVSPALPAGLSLDPSTGRVTGTATEPRPSTTYTVTMSDLAGDATADLTLTVDSAETQGGGGESPGGGEQPGGGEHQGGGGGGGSGEHPAGGSENPGGGESRGGDVHSPGAGADAPNRPSPRPAAPSHLTLTRARVTPRPFILDAAGKVTRARLTFRLSRPAAVRLRLKGDGMSLTISLGRRPVGRSALNLRPKLAHRTLAPGRYRAVMSAKTAGETAKRTLKLRIKDAGRG